MTTLMLSDSKLGAATRTMPPSSVQIKKTASSFVGDHVNLPPSKTVIGSSAPDQIGSMIGVAVGVGVGVGVDVGTVVGVVDGVGVAVGSVVAVEVLVGVLVATRVGVDVGDGVSTNHCVSVG